jgi:Protein of unknown function (DUF3592)
MPDKNTYFRDDDEPIEQGTLALGEQSRSKVRPRRSRLAVIAGALCVIAGMFIAAATFAFWKSETYFVSISESADAVVTALKKDQTRSRSGNNVLLYHAVFEFTTRRGQRVRAVDNVARTETPYPVGSHIKIYYDPRDPETAQIDAFAERWGFTCGLGIFALVFLVVGVCLMTLREHKRS